MEFTTIVPWIWIGAGLLLVLFEFLLPGLIVIFLGMASLIVGIVLLLGFSLTVPWQLFSWVFLSGVLIVFLREQFASFFPGLESSSYTPAESDHTGENATVTETVFSDKSTGRVRYQDSSWSARSEDGQIYEPGTEVRVVGRDNLTLLVRKVAPLE